MKNGSSSGLFVMGHEFEIERESRNKLSGVGETRNTTGSSRNFWGITQMEDENRGD